MYRRKMVAIAKRNKIERYVENNIGRRGAAA